MAGLSVNGLLLVSQGNALNLWPFLEHFAVTRFPVAYIRCMWIDASMLRIKAVLSVKLISAE